MNQNYGLGSLNEPTGLEGNHQETQILSLGLEVGRDFDDEGEENGLVRAEMIKNQLK